MLEGRPPRDPDVVTFYRLPAGQSQQDVRLSAPHLFPSQPHRARTTQKQTFCVDAYLVHLGMIPERLVEVPTGTACGHIAGINYGKATSKSISHLLKTLPQVIAAINGIPATQERNHEPTRRSAPLLGERSAHSSA
ncbi:MAG: hypothetical protein R3F44_17170 [Candidatus Competibacteraceae bacterium]